jgi:hypothetical protein
MDFDDLVTPFAGSAWADARPVHALPPPPSEDHPPLSRATRWGPEIEVVDWRDRTWQSSSGSSTGVSGTRAKALVEAEAEAFRKADAAQGYRACRPVVFLLL